MNTLKNIQRTCFGFFISHILKFTLKKKQGFYFFPDFPPKSKFLGSGSFQQEKYCYVDFSFHIGVNIVITMISMKKYFANLIC